MLEQFRGGIILAGGSGRPWEVVVTWSSGV